MMRTSKKNQQPSAQAELILAIKALASEKEISEELLFNAIEEALQAAFKKNVARDENPPTRSPSTPPSRSAATTAWATSPRST